MAATGLVGAGYHLTVRNRPGLHQGLMQNGGGGGNRERILRGAVEPRGVGFRFPALTMFLQALLLLAPVPSGAPPRAPAPQGIAKPMDADTAPGVYLPEGPAQRAWASVGPATVPARRSPQPAAPGPAETWRLWGEGLATESAAQAAGQPASPQTRRALALFALDQGRALDAWGHLAACGADAAMLADLMPRFLPGTAAPAGPGGLPRPLPDGALLTPALPPRTPAARPGVLEWRSASLFGLRVGEASLALRVAVESTGVQVDVQHLSGGPARLRLRIPEPPGYEIRVEYVDWFRQDTLREPLDLKIEPGDRVHTFFGRFLARRSDQPVPLPGHMPAGLLQGGLRLVLSAGPDEQVAAALSELDAAARAIGHLLGIVVTASSEAPAQPSSAARPWSCTTVRIPPGSAGRRVLASIAAAIEARLLP